MLLTALLLLSSSLEFQGPFPAKDGERCVICRGKTDSTDVAYLVNGERVAVMKIMEDDFLRNPLDALARMHGKGNTLAVHDAHGVAGAPVWVGLFVAVSLLFGATCARLAIIKGQPAWRWFVLGMLFSAPACLALALRETRRETDS